MVQFVHLLKIPVVSPTPPPLFLEAKSVPLFRILHWDHIQSKRPEKNSPTLYVPPDLPKPPTARSLFLYLSPESIIRISPTVKGEGKARWFGAVPQKERVRKNSSLRYL